MNIKKVIGRTCIIAALAASALSLSGCAAVESMVKDFESDTTKLNRVVKLYDYSVNLIETWEGEMRIESESSQSCSFIIDGERYTINGGIIVTEEVE